MSVKLANLAGSILAIALRFNSAILCSALDNRFVVSRHLETSALFVGPVAMRVAFDGIAGRAISSETRPRPVPVIAANDGPSGPRGARSGVGAIAVGTAGTHSGLVPLW
jgi:hypothetical protein